MTYSVDFLHAAETEIADAIDWYEEQEAGLGSEFRVSVETVVAAIEESPLAFPVIYGSAVRRVLTRKFPYSVIYTVVGNTVLVIAVFHSSRNPMIWRGRV
jgi:plasmid stabilization system protein ParE